MSELKAAARRIRITPSMNKPVHLQGYDENNVATSRSESDLYARVLLLECDGVRALIVTLDSCFASDATFWACDGDKYRELSPALRPGTRNAWAEAARCASDAVFVSPTHTHTGPVRLGNGEGEIYDAIEAGIRGALATLEPATLAIRTKTDPDFTDAVTGIPGLARLRRPGLIPHEAGKAAYPIDHTMTVVRIGRAEKGAAPIAVLANYGIHPTLNETVTRMSPDFVGEAMLKFEAASKETVALFLQGCSGDVCPVLWKGNDSRIAELAGYLYNHTAGALDGDMEPLTPVAPSGVTRAFRPTTRPNYNRKPEVVVSGVRFAAEAVLLGVSGELFSGYRWRIAGLAGAALDRRAYPHALVCGMVNGYSGYLPAAEDFDPASPHYVREGPERLTYEMNVTPYTSNIERELMSEVDAVLKALA